MKRPRIRLRWLVPLAILLLPPLLWALLLSVVPTDWARQRIVARMSQASGRTVRIATLRVGVLGGIYLTGLEIGAPGTAGDPLLKVAEAHINVSPLQLFCGQVEPTETDVRGIKLRVLRREDGSLELDDLSRGARPRRPRRNPSRGRAPARSAA
jgi:AsmA protein